MKFVRLDWRVVSRLRKILCGFVGFCAGVPRIISMTFEVIHALANAPIVNDQQSAVSAYCCPCQRVDYA
jgi:hypothetical protein